VEADGGWLLDEADAIGLARCRALDGVPGVAHGVSIRRSLRGGEADMGPAEGASAAVVATRAAFARAAGFGGRPLAILRQVHGNRVVDARAAAGTVEADGVILFPSEGFDLPVPAVRTADCVGMLAASVDGGAFAAVHAGWRGIAAGIASEAIARFGERGVPADDLVIALGPSIGPCCYEVGEEVVSALEAACGSRERFVHARAGRRPHVDLHAALTLQLTRAGVIPAAVHPAPWCTRCRNDLFFSVRAEGPGAGRGLAAIGPAAAAP
jgi:purine-nucleoside/S-methyl-5'-thioadenosine phosphorylase / adenosine deaminase